MLNQFGKFLETAAQVVPAPAQQPANVQMHMPAVPALLTQAEGLLNTLRETVTLVQQARAALEIGTLGLNTETALRVARAAVGPENLAPRPLAQLMAGVLTQGQQPQAREYAIALAGDTADRLPEIITTAGQVLTALTTAAAELTQYYQTFQRLNVTAAPVVAAPVVNALPAPEQAPDQVNEVDRPRLG